MLFAAAFPLSDSWLVDLAECWVVLEAVQRVVHHGFSLFVIESDSQRVVRLLYGVSDDISEVGKLVQLVREDILAGSFCPV